MKSNNPMIDDAQRLLESVLPTVQQGFAEVYAALLGLGIAPQLNYNHLKQLLKDIEAPYNTWENHIKILEEIADIEPTVLGKYKENLQRIYDFGQDVRRLGGIDIASLESSQNGQARLDELYINYRTSFLQQLVPPMQQASKDIIGASTIKDQRPMIEKYAPFIEILPPENKLIFIQNIEDNSRTGKNPVAVELHYLTQMSQNVYRAIYPLPNQVPPRDEGEAGGDNPVEGNDNSNRNQQDQNEDPEMIRQLQAQLEQMRQERDQATGQRDDVLEQLTARDQIIAEQNDRLTEFNNNMPQLAQLQQQLTQERDQAIRGMDEANNQRDEANQRADQMTIERDTALEQRDTALDQVADKDRIIEENKEVLKAEKDKNTGLTNNLTAEKLLTKKLTDENIDLTNNLKIKDEKLEALKDKVDDLRDLNKALKDHQESLKESNKIFITDKKIWQEEKKILTKDIELLVNEKNHYYDLSIEQANQVSLLKEIHCNLPEHEWIIPKISGDASIQTDQLI